MSGRHLNPPGTCQCSNCKARRARLERAGPARLREREAVRQEKKNLTNRDKPKPRLIFVQKKMKGGNRGDSPRPNHGKSGQEGKEDKCTLNMHNPCFSVNSRESGCATT